LWELRVTQTVVARIEEIAQKVIEEVIQNVASAGGLEVVEVELKGSGRNQMLRIYVDKPGGVTHADCEAVSHGVGNALEGDEVLPNQYTLEVSSPGVERKLKKWKDFERFQGQRMKVVLREPLIDVEPIKAAGPPAPAKGPNGKAALKHLDGKTGLKHCEGILQSAHDGTLKMELTDGRSVQFPFEQVDRANLKFEW